MLKKKKNLSPHSKNMSSTLTEYEHICIHIKFLCMFKWSMRETLKRLKTKCQRLNVLAMISNVNELIHEQPSLTVPLYMNAVRIQYVHTLLMIKLASHILYADPCAKSELYFGLKKLKSFD